MEHLNLPSRIFMYSICASIEYDLKKHILKYCGENINFTTEMKEKANQRLNSIVSIYFGKFSKKFLPFKIA